MSAPRKRKPFYYGWVIVAVVALAGFTQSAESFPVLGVFLKPITEEFEWSRTVYTGAMTIGTVLGGAIALGVGPFLDRFGGRWVLVGSFAVLGVVWVLMAEISTLWQFYVLQVLARMLMIGVVGLAMGVIIPKWFVAKRGRAVALGGMGAKLGNAVTPLYIQYFIGLRSWRLAALVSGLLVWGVSLIPTAILLRRQPEDMGLRPDGADDDPTPAQQTAAQASQRARPDVSMSLHEVLQYPAFFLLTASVMLTSFAQPSLNLHTIPYLTDQGVGAGTAAAVLTVWAVFGGIGSLALGFLVERYGIRGIMAVNQAVIAAGFVLLFLVDSPGSALVWGAYMGLVQGGNFFLQPVLFADYFGRESLGAIRGVVWLVQMLAHASGPLAASLAYDMLGDYVAILLVFGAFTFLGGVLIAFAQPPDLSARRAQRGPAGP